MSKAYVIKNKDGKYLGVCASDYSHYWTSIDFAHYFRYLPNYDPRQEAEDFKNSKYPDCEVIEITITEDDLVEGLKKQINDLKSQLDQANERLKGAIIPKFKSEDIAYRISFFTKKVEKVAIIRTHIDTGSLYEIYYTIAILEDEQTFNDITPYFNISQEPEDELYATKAEAEKKLKEELRH